jgi:hypothetical protein
MLRAGCGKQPNRNSHLPVRQGERKRQGFKSAASAQRFMSAQAAVYNTLCTQSHLTNGRTAFRLKMNQNVLPGSKMISK